MAFRKLAKPKKSTASAQPAITISASDKKPGQAPQACIFINQMARRVLGDPVALTLEWDDENYLLRLVAAPLDDPAAYRIQKSTNRISVTAIMRDLGIDCTRARVIPVTQSGRTAIVADLSEMPSTGMVLPMRRTA